MSIRAAAASLAKVGIPIPVGGQAVIVQSPTAKAYIWPSVEHEGFCHILVFDPWPAGDAAPALNTLTVTSKKPIQGEALAMILPDMGVSRDHAEVLLIEDCHAWVIPALNLFSAEPDLGSRSLALGATPRATFERAVEDIMAEGSLLTAEAIVERARAHA